MQKKKKKLVYIANTQFPTVKARGIQIAKTIEALIKEGIEVTVLCHSRKDDIGKTIKEYYDLDTKFIPKRLFAVDLYKLIPGSVIPFYFEVISFSISAAFWLMRNKSFKLIYTRDWYSAFLLSFLPQRKVFLELHLEELPKTKIGQLSLKVTLKKVEKAIAVNPLLAKKIKSISNKNISVVPNAADPKLYSKKITKKSAREKLNLPKDEFLVVYTGGFYRRKGVFTLAEASHLLPDKVVLCFIGGTDKQITSLDRSLKKERKDIVRKYQPFKLMHLYHIAADVLVIPNSSQASHSSSKFTTPIKLFEYFQVKRPILASDIPAIREFAQDSADYFKPDSARDLARKIVKLKNNLDYYKSFQQKAVRKAHKYTWQKRAKQIIKLVDK